MKYFIFRTNEKGKCKFKLTMAVQMQMHMCSLTLIEVVWNLFRNFTNRECLHFKYIALLVLGEFFAFFLFVFKLKKHFSFDLYQIKFTILYCIILYCIVCYRMLSYKQFFLFLLRLFILFSHCFMFYIQAVYLKIHTTHSRLWWAWIPTTIMCQHLLLADTFFHVHRHCFCFRWKNQQMMINVGEYRHKTEIDYITH